MTEPDLFSYASRYPLDPGHKVSGTSEAAAHAMRGRAVTLRAKVLLALAAGPMTADEAADAIGESVLAIRPRFSELQRLGRIEDTDARRPNKSGKTAIVWRLVSTPNPQTT